MDLQHVNLSERDSLIMIASLEERYSKFGKVEAVAALETTFTMHGYIAVTDSHFVHFIPGILRTHMVRSITNFPLSSILHAKIRSAELIISTDQGDHTFSLGTVNSAQYIKAHLKNPHADEGAQHLLDYGTKTEYGGVSQNVGDLLKDFSEHTYPERGKIIALSALGSDYEEGAFVAVTDTYVFRHSVGHPSQRTAKETSPDFWAETLSRVISVKSIDKTIVIRTLHETRTFQCASAAASRVIVRACTPRLPEISPGTDPETKADLTPKIDSPAVENSPTKTRWIIPAAVGAVVVGGIWLLTTQLSRDEEPSNSQMVAAASVESSRSNVIPSSRSAPSSASARTGNGSTNNSVDSRFISALDELEIYYSSRASAIESAKTICSTMRSMRVTPESIDALIDTVYYSGSLTYMEAEMFLGLSVHAYCSEYSDDLPY